MANEGLRLQVCKRTCSSDPGRQTPSAGAVAGHLESQVHFSQVMSLEHHTVCPEPLGPSPLSFEPTLPRRIAIAENGAIAALRRKQGSYMVAERLVIFTYIH